MAKRRGPHEPLLRELARQVGAALGTPAGVIVFDPSGFAKKGTESVGVQRQWCGRLGKLDNGQVGVYMAYASPTEHALVDVRLYLPQEWAGDKHRRHKCDVPKTVKFLTRHQLALQMLDERGPLLPHGCSCRRRRTGPIFVVSRGIAAPPSSATCRPFPPTH